MRRFSIGLMFAAFQVCLGAAATDQEPCSKAIPSALNAMVAKEYPGWVVVSTAMLSSDDLEIWNQLGHADDCPGVAKGRFLGKHVGYGVLLATVQQGRRYERVIAARRVACDLYEAIDMLTPTEAELPSVITVVPPGSYTASDGHGQVVTEHDAIAVTRLEAGTLLLYYHDRSVTRLGWTE